MTEEQKEEFKKSYYYRKVAPSFFTIINRKDLYMRDFIREQRDIEKLFDMKIRVIFSSEKLERENGIFKQHVYSIGVIEEPKEFVGEIAMIDVIATFDIRIRDFHDGYLCTILKTPFGIKEEHHQHDQRNDKPR